MMFPNHIVGGLVFTGTFSAIMGENLFDSPTKIAVCVFASALPDIDNPKAPIGLLVRPLSQYLNKHYGHRTITHTALLLSVGTLIFWLLKFHALIFFFAFLSHLLFDMCTIQGIPFFYPLQTICVIPGQKEFRMRTGDVKSEALVMSGFILIGVTLQPLMSQGFWTSYNSQWGTQKHLSSEYQKSKDLLEVNYSYDIGSESYNGNGYTVEATETKTVVLEKDKFTTLTEKDMKIKSVTFKHTGKEFYFKNQIFINISADSLNSIIQQKHIVEIEVQTNSFAKVIESGKEQTFKNFKSYYPNSLLFYAKDSSYTAQYFQYVPSAAARLKRLDIQSMKEDYNLKLQNFNNRQNELQNLLSENTTEPVKREQNMQRIAKLKNETAPVLDEIRIRQIETEAQIAESQDAQINELRRQDFERNEREKSARIERVTFSGNVRYVYF